MAVQKPVSSREPDSQHLQRNLSNRHIQLIAIGGAIGTGLFMGSGKSISLAGPSILFVYLIIGFVLFFVMRAMGELLLSNPQYKSFIDFATDLLGPWAGFFTGWTYWFCWIVTGMADVIAISAYAQFWFPGLPQWYPAIACVGLLLSLNLLTVKLFGEIEFWFALIKIAAIVGLVLTGGYLLVSAAPFSLGRAPSVTNLWADGGMFPHGLTGFLAGFQIAVFAFVGIELVGTAAAETKDPARTLPRAINSIPVRIILFYVLALATIMIVTPWREVAADKSPFVELFVIAGLPAAAGIINFVVMTSAASSANGGIFSTSRMLFGLAGDGQAPQAFKRLSKRSVPANGLVFSVFCLALGTVVMYLIPNLMEAFTLITTLSAILFIFVWSIILASYLAYLKKRPQLHAQSSFPMPGGKIMSWLALGFFAMLLVILTFKQDTRVALYIAPFWFLALGVAYLLMRKRAAALSVA
jgi:D-serine/D-alanine/glycine transporter